jgi:hypothetical protein
MQRVQAEFPVFVGKNFREPVDYGRNDWKPDISPQHPDNSRLC